VPRSSPLRVDAMDSTHLPQSSTEPCERSRPMRRMRRRRSGCSRVQTATRRACRRRPAADGNARRVHLGNVFHSVERRHASCIRLLKAALTLPLAAGSTVAIVSSGAAVAGSTLSGGYAGAKRMQWFMARIRTRSVGRQEVRHPLFFAVLPRQLIEGTEIRNYCGRQLRCDARVLSRRSFSSVAGKYRLTPIKSAPAIVGGLRGDLADGVTAIGWPVKASNRWSEDGRSDARAVAGDGGSTRPIHGARRRTFAPELHRYCARIDGLRSSTDGEDVVQEL